ncbi:hypothetical protein CC80DRAFT_555038 [Byssothecium circinans]|uniref:Uncharacterized protein n=1 Tax=Byssothecium circinans TaxID=147558 RepID=A0A6A5TC02_9PLEO|nr:hypothetical protein CC80DRAFT_555038 [Byssothecium circinans]
MRASTLVTFFFLAFLGATNPLTNFEPGSASIIDNGRPKDEHGAEKIFARDRQLEPKRALVTFSDHSQAEFRNTKRQPFDKEVIDVLALNCYCALWETQQCAGVVTTLQMCEGPISTFRQPVKAITCGGWRPPF